MLHNIYDARSHEHKKECKIFQIKVVEAIKTQFICQMLSFFKKKYRLWDNVQKYCRLGQTTDDNIIKRMRIVSWITKATHKHTLTVCNTHCIFTATMVARTGLNVTLYVHCLGFIYMHYNLKFIAMTFNIHTQTSAVPSMSFLPQIAWYNYHDSRRSNHGYMKVTAVLSKLKRQNYSNIQFSL
jgi:hypothetical protein